MTSDHAQDWNNYWQGRSAKASGNALLGVGIENNDVLTTFWQEVFNEISKSTKTIDFACGAGSVLTHASEMGFSDLTGIDVSKNAIDVLKAKLPKVSGVVGAVDKTPFDTASFDMVVSQFGFEYAGGPEAIISTATEMTRILKPGGQIVLVAHIDGGAIASGCQRSLEQIALIQESGFFKSATDTFSAIYKAQESSKASDKDAMTNAMSNLNQAAQPIMTWLKRPGASQNEFARFAAHLLDSTHKLLVTHKKYALVDCVSWLDNMKAEVLAYEGRMSSMTGAAISEDLVSQIQNVFESKGFNASRPEKLYFKAGDLPAAWVLKAA